MNVVLRYLLTALLVLGAIAKLVQMLMPSQTQAPNINITNNHVYMAQSCNKYDAVQWSQYLR